MLDALGNIGDFVGGVAVIATLFYLAIQIRRNTMIVRSASADTVYAASQELQKALWADPDLSELFFQGISGRSPLSDADGRRFYLILSSCARLWERAYFKAEEGSLETKVWFSLNDQASATFSWPGVQPFLNEIRTLCSQEFVEFMDREIRKKAKAAVVDTQQDQVVGQ
jgi:hypothetical protein